MTELLVELAGLTGGGAVTLRVEVPDERAGLLQTLFECVTEAVLAADAKALTAEQRAEIVDHFRAAAAGPVIVPEARSVAVDEVDGS